jgi:hypothetical protein
LKPDLFLSILRDGAPKEPKVERGSLEYQSSNNQLKEFPEVHSRLGHQAESKRNLGFRCQLHNSKEATPTCCWNAKSARKLQSTLKRHFVQEGKPERKTDYPKVLL